MSINIFLSSNSRDGYSQDVVDLFAKPNGYYQQFRYALKWISAEVSNCENWTESGKGERAILCYVDQKSKDMVPKIVPVRFARISDIRLHGSTVSIVFELESLCKFNNLEEINKYFRQLSQELPAYANGELHGKYWLRVNEIDPQKCGCTDDLGDWERLVEFYYETPNAVDCTPFYRFERLLDLRKNKAVNPSLTDGLPTYQVDGGGEYEVQVYHYHPIHHFPGFILAVSAGGDTFISVNGERRTLNTRYDQKDYRFRASKSVLGGETRLSFQRKEANTGNLIWEDFQVRILTRPSVGLALFSIGFTTAGFAIPFIVRAFTDPANDWPVIIGAIAGGLVIGTITVAKDDYNRAIALLSNAWDRVKGVR